MIIKTLGLFTALLFSAPLALAEKTETCQGKASWHHKDIYTEKIESRFDNKGNILSTVTTYVDSDGKVLAKMDAQFTDGLSTPDHHFYDERSQFSYGTRHSGEKIVMYAKAKDKEEKTRELEKDFKPGHLMLAGPGLNPYLKANFEEIRKHKEVPIVLLIPGDLTTYNFKVVLKREADGVAEFDVIIESWFLRLFAPRVRFKYDSKTQRVFQYEGISNVKNDHDDLQKVEIDYFCE